MTISTATPNWALVVGDGTNDPFTVAVNGADTADIAVYKITTTTGKFEELLVAGTHYTLAGGGGGQFTCTPITGATDFAAGTDWFFVLEPEFVQQKDFSELDSLSPGSIEDQLDRQALYSNSVQAMRGQVHQGQLEISFLATGSGLATDKPVSISGASMLIGSPVVLGVPHQSLVFGGTFSAFVSSDTVVTIRFHNYTANTITPPTGVFRVIVFSGGL